MPSYKVMGVATPDMIDIEVRTLRELGFKRAFVMHGLEHGSDRGMDELSTVGPSHVAELHPDGRIERSIIAAEDLGVAPARFEDLASTRDVKQNALRLLGVILGKDAGPRADIVCLNAAPLLYVMGKARNLEEGIAMARAAIRTSWRWAPSA